MLQQTNHFVSFLPVSLSNSLEIFFLANNPVFPGVILIEALAQVGGILVMHSIDNPKNHIPYLAGIENFRFRKMIRPGDTIIMRLRFIRPIKRNIAKMKVEAFVGNEIVGEGNMTATIAKLDYERK